MAEKQPYDLIPVTPDNLFKYTGNYFHKFEQGVYSVMRKMCPDYTGGSYEFRLYPNGAFAMVLKDDGETKHKVVPFNGNYVDDCSFEAISLAANLTMYSHLCCEAFEKNDTKHNQMMHDQYHGLRDALCGIMRYVIVQTEEGTRPVTDAEAMDYEQIGQRAHAEIGQIMEIID